MVLKEKYPYFVTGSKTDTGKNRIVPIHNFIKPYVEELLLCKGKKISR